MKIIKKDGKLQDFDEKKLYASLSNASNSTEGSELNESDIKVIVEDIVKKVKTVRSDENPSSSYEIRGIMMDVLLKDGFTSVLKTYLYY